MHHQIVTWMTINLCHIYTEHILLASPASATPNVDSLHSHNYKSGSCLYSRRHLEPYHLLLTLNESPKD